MVVMAIPIFTGNDAGKTSGDSVADRTEYYTTAKNLLTSGADAMERLMTAYKVGSSQTALTDAFSGVGNFARTRCQICMAKTYV
jgi:hypothetical protein